MHKRPGKFLFFILFLAHQYGYVHTAPASAKTACRGSTSLAFAQDWSEDSFITAAAQHPRSTQSASLKGHSFPCSNHSGDGFSKRPPWRCIHCHVIMKGTFPRCWKCGFEWAQCADRDFVPPDQKQQDEATWGSAQWQYQNPKSPRTRSRRPSRSKHRQSDAQWQGGDQQGYHGGGGQGHGHMQQGQMTMPTMPPMGSRCSQ